jgi:uncharacterized SAM-binding protein YcdF (DUF218 family)
VKHRLLLQGLGFITLVLFFLSAYTPLSNRLASRTAVHPQVGPAQAIVVLGIGLESDGSLGGLSLQRTARGVELWQEGLAPLLVFLGPIDNQGRSEADARAELARRWGVPPAAILAYKYALSTHEEAVRMQGVLQPRGIRRILLVTDTHHMARARSVFERAGFQVLPASINDSVNTHGSPQGRLILIHDILREFLARVYYRAIGYL